MGAAAPLLFLLAALAIVAGTAHTVAALGILVACFACAFLAARFWVRRTLPEPSQGVVAFFHPFADGGGGGERVLWAAVQALQQERPDVQVAIYCREGSSPQQLSEDALQRFGLVVSPSFRVVPLSSAHLLLPERYPRLTMLRQAVGSVRVAAEGLRQLVPELYVDTTGWAFPYPLVRLAGASVAAYVHYPTISTDMLQRVRDRHSTYNNSPDVVSSAAKSALKLVYYRLFALLYGAVGSCANCVMVNSSWTRRHIRELWWQWREPARVYPPCDTAALRALPLDRRLKRVSVVSVAQFRPEKDHALQLRTFALARQQAQRLHDPAGDAVLAARLQMVGGCRGEPDRQRLAELQALALQLGLEDAVEFRVDAPSGELRALLGEAVAGLHTMADEHFGISVVEYMAAGVVPIAHDSGGPREDIVVAEPAPSGGGMAQPVGYRCSTLHQYADALVEVLGMGQVQRMRITAAARRRSQQFSDERFQREFLACLQGLLPPQPVGSMAQPAVLAAEQQQQQQ